MQQRSGSSVVFSLSRAVLQVTVVDNSIWVIMSLEWTRFEPRMKVLVGKMPLVMPMSLVSMPKNVAF